MAERAIQSGAQWIDGSARRPMVCSRSVIRGRTIPKDRLGRLATICQKDGEETPAIDVLRRLSMEGFIDSVGSEGVTRTGSNDQQRGS